MKMRVAVIALIQVATILGVVAQPASASHTCQGLASNIHGGAGNDTLNGTPGNDVITGLGGNDTIRGLGGNDVICGGTGDDRIEGGDGNDQITGDAGHDQLFGQAGVDSLVGDLLLAVGGTFPIGGNDYLDGGLGGDFFLIGDYFLDARAPLTAAGGRDELVDPDGVGIAAGDSASGGTDHGNGGQDRLRITNNVASPFGFVILLGDSSGADGASGNGANDEMTLLGSLGAILIGDSFSADGTVSGGGGADRLTSSVGDDELFGDHAVCPSTGPCPPLIGAGPGGGNDGLIAGNGNDTLHGGPASDRCDGGAGTDSAPDADCESRISIP